VAAKDFYQKEKEMLKREMKKQLTALKQKYTKAKNSRDKYYDDYMDLLEKQMGHKSELKGHQ
jgi:hypothetical protein